MTESALKDSHTRLHDSDDDAELMRRVCAGDHDAFTLIVSRYANPVKAYLFRLTRSRDRAEDLSQETLFRLYRTAPRYVQRYGAEKSIRQLLFKIARRLVIDAVRSEPVRRRAFDHLV